MINIEKRLMPWCEECEVFAPCSMKLREKQDDNSYAIKAVVTCSHADICSNAVHQYQKHLMNTSAMLEFESVIENISEPSPCRDCKTLHKSSCTGCEARSEWIKKEKKND